MTSMGFLVRQRAEGKMISAIFSIPLFGPQNCKIDFLHVCDLGTTSDFLGSLLYFLMEFVVSGNSRREKCVTLFREIDAFYRANNSENRLPKLVPTMLRAELHGKLKSPKLRAKAGEARVLVPCAVQLAEKFLDTSVPAQNTMIHACHRLNSMYSCLSEHHWLPERFQQASREFLLLMSGLESHFEDLKLFRIKPKAHLLMELAVDDVNPSKHWTYRDESFGHSLALLARRRGGQFSMKAVSNAVLKRFLAGNQLPRLDE